MAKRVTINNSKNHGDPVSPIPLPKVQNVFTPGLDFFFISVPGLLQYIFYLDPLLNLSNFICDLTRTYQSIRDWKVFKIMLAKQTFPISLCHSNHHLCHICRNCQRKSKETLCVILGW